jgi:hypothetical protein
VGGAAAGGGGGGAPRAGNCGGEEQGDGEAKGEGERNAGILHCVQNDSTDGQRQWNIQTS